MLIGELDYIVVEAEFAHVIFHIQVAAFVVVGDINFLLGCAKIPGVVELGGSEVSRCIRNETLWYNGESDLPMVT